jgi:hypothetical protein
MTVEILKDGIKLPAQNNLAWTFPVRLDGRGPVPWSVDSFDLSVWFKEAVGRYPRRDRGDEDEKEDIRENWSQVEPRLRAEAEREARLPAMLGVDGTRTSADEWSQARSIPKEDLPPLSDPQRAAAKSLGVSEEAYARMVFASERTSKKLLTKTERLARFLAEKLRGAGSKATVEDVTLRTLENRFDVAIKLNGDVIPLRIDEDVVDDLFESGSAEADQRLARILSAMIGIPEKR